MTTEAPVGAEAEKHEFQAEIKQLLHILIYSLYTNKEIFIRELISNASDALDKARHEELVNDDVLDKDTPLEISITMNEKEKTLVISDNGIGMSHDELIANIGTLGKSGSVEFFKKLTEEAKKDANIIGQFGVGFYSAFMAASEVRVITKSYQGKEPACEWKSDGSGSYTITPSEKKERGTTIEICLKDDAKEFLEKTKIEEVIKKHSNFVNYPIKVDGKRINEVSALWTKSPSGLKDEDYVGFYKYLTNGFDKPLFHIHYSVDAPIDIKALMYVPERNIELTGFGKDEPGLALYSKKILIKSECKELLPDYLRFLKGVVDSEDLPLNVSRETIQEDVLFSKIKSNVVSKFISQLNKLSEKDPEQFKKIWDQFGRNIKEGVGKDFANREKLSHLLRLNSSICSGSNDLVSLKEYIGRMKEGQKEIFFFSGTSREEIERSPHMEIFKKKEVEVLYMLDPVDEYLLTGFNEYEKTPLKSIDQADLDFLKEIEEKQEERPVVEQSKFDKLFDRFKTVLGDRVKDVKESKRLSDSPCCILNPEGMETANIQKLMKMVNKDYTVGAKILEVNAGHPLIQNLSEILNTEKNLEVVDRCCEQLFDNALILDDLSFNIKDMVPRITGMMEESTNVLLDKYGKGNIIISP
ncbi:MAG: molecular chaperone HtpG [Nitrospinota bacterium]